MKVYVNGVKIKSTEMEWKQQNNCISMNPVLNKTHYKSCIYKCEIFIWSETYKSNKLTGAKEKAKIHKQILLTS